MKKKILFLGLLIACISVRMFAQDDNDVLGRDYANELNAIRTTVPFLTIATDSRSGAMGDAGAASTPDLNSQHWNPAKYVFLKKKMGVSVSYTPWLIKLKIYDLNLGYLAGYYKFDDKQVLSAALRYFDLGSIDLTDNNGEKIRTAKPNELAFDMAYSRLLSDNFSGALAFRFIYSDIAGGSGGLNNIQYNPGISYAADLAVYYQKAFELDGKGSEYAFGLDISNIGSKMSYSEGDDKEFIPTNMRLGGRFSIDMDEYNKISVIADLNKMLVPTPPARNAGDTIIAGKDDNVGVFKGMLQSFYDAPGGFKEEMHEIAYSLGAEYWYRQQFAIRAGYFHEHETKGKRSYMTVGIGIQLNVFSLDFSYLVPVGDSNSPLAHTMRFTLGFAFE